MYLETEARSHRLVEGNSPCHYNHVDSDINSWHFYINDHDNVRQHVQRVSTKLPANLYTSAKMTWAITLCRGLRR
ncbi:MAG: hypothetical protein R2867_45695 [Caldilineaceae bacterium]